jgi:hypothetical protein
MRQLGQHLLELKIKPQFTLTANDTVSQGQHRMNRQNLSNSSLKSNVLLRTGGPPPGKGRNKNGIFSVVDPEQKDVLTRTPAGTK